MGWTVPSAPGHEAEVQEDEGAVLLQHDVALVRIRVDDARNLRKQGQWASVIRPPLKSLKYTGKYHPTHIEIR